MSDKNKLLVTTGIVGVAGVLGIAFAMGAFDGSDEGSISANPKAVSKDRLVAQSNGGTCNPCAAQKCNPCAAKKCNPCNPCAAKNPCSPCGPCNPCNPCAAKNPCSPCGPCNPCNPCAAKNPCSPCGPCNPCNPCNPCAAKGGGKLSAEEAKTAYSAVLEAGNPYAGADIDGAADYRDWSRYNTAPYQSATHGGRYVNNYANAAAEAYGKFEEFGEMPVGSILAKDSFTVDASGTASPGPLFLMRKMKGGFRPDFGNWEYTLIMPDGNVYGVTNGAGSDNVEFCGTCHLAVANQDHMFFLPDEYRTE